MLWKKIYIYVVLYFRAERNNGNTHAWINARNMQGRNEYLSTKSKGYIHPIQLCQNTPSTVSLLPPPISLLTYPTIVFSGNANGKLAILGARNTYQSFYSHCQSVYSLLDLMAVVVRPHSSHHLIPYPSTLTLMPPQYPPSYRKTERQYNYELSVANIRKAKVTSTTAYREQEHGKGYQTPFPPTFPPSSTPRANPHTQHNPSTSTSQVQHLSPKHAQQQLDHS